MSALDPAHTVRELKELRALTGDEHGAQRLAWTEPWARARDWLAGLLDGLPVTREVDEAGNVWITLAGAREEAVLIGGHLDSVPNGGWLDGCLDVLAGLEVLRRLAADAAATGTPPPVTVKLVDWADEEGARFARSLVGSSAFSGNFDPAVLGALRDAGGTTLREAMAAHGFDIDRAPVARARAATARAYVELHIEQGPVLERLGLPLAAVVGTTGIQRHRITLTGVTSHAGSTPMDVRRDPLAAGARILLELREIARRHGGVGTVGGVVPRPGIITAIAAECDLLTDMRHIDRATLEGMLGELHEAVDRIAAEEGVGQAWEPILELQPTIFHPELVDLAEEAVREVAGPDKGQRMPSGPGHDGIETVRAGVPSVMLFVQSLRGLSHNKDEDTLEEHLELSVRALDVLVDKTIAWVAAGGGAPA